MKYKINDTKDINDIKNMYVSGQTLKNISIFFNCSINTINRILIRLNIKRRTNKDYRKYTLNSNFFETIDSHEKAAIFGFLCADGYNNQKSGKLKIGIHKQDIDYLYKINECIQPNKKDPIRFSYSSKFKQKPDKNNRDISCLTIYCQKICDDLAKLGCGQAKSLTIEFPYLSNEFLPSFLLGYNDGDGCITFHQHKSTWTKQYMVNICVSDVFGVKAKKIIENILNIKVGILKKGKISSLYINGNTNVLKFLDWIYSKSSIKLDRKYKKYLDMKEYFKSINIE